MNTPWREEGVSKTLRLPNGERHSERHSEHIPGERRAFQRSYGTLPVKLMPARCSEEVTVSPNTGPSDGTNWMMSGGRPQSRSTL